MHKQVKCIWTDTTTRCSYWGGSHLKTSKIFRKLLCRYSPYFVRAGQKYIIGVIIDFKVFWYLNSGHKLLLLTYLYYPLFIQSWKDIFWVSNPIPELHPTITDKKYSHLNKTLKSSRAAISLCCRLELWGAQESGQFLENALALSIFWFFQGPHYKVRRFIRSSKTFPNFTKHYKRF